MKIVDPSHEMNMHAPGRVGRGGNKTCYEQNLRTRSIVARRIEAALHVGAHVDGREDMASCAMPLLVDKGAVAGVSEKVGDGDVIAPDMLESAPVDIEDGDILIPRAGSRRCCEGRPRQDLARRFRMHPGGGRISSNGCATAGSSGSASTPARATIR